MDNILVGNLLSENMFGVFFPSSGVKKFILLVLEVLRIYFEVTNAISF